MVKRDDGFKDFVLDQLTELPGLRCRAMFGGYGLYCTGFFFGIIHQGRLYFKTDKTTGSRYRRFGMQPFRPNRTQRLKNYYQVPVEIIESPEDLTQWAIQSAHL